MSVPKRDFIAVDESELRKGICSFLEPEITVILFTGDYRLAIQTAATPTSIWAVVPQPEIGGLARRLEFLLDRNVRKRSSPGP